MNPRPGPRRPSSTPRIQDEAPAPGAPVPLAALLLQTADAVQAVRQGRSLRDALARCPAALRPGTQALAFHALRWLGAAQVVRAQLAPKAPPPALDALLLTALALLWPAGEPPYAAHTLVDQAVAATRRRAPGAAAFVNAVLRRFLREEAAIVERALAEPLAEHNHPTWWIERLRRDWPAQWSALLAADNRRPPMTLRVNARRGDAAGYLERLGAAGLAGRAIGTHGVMLEQPCAVERLPGFADGEVSVQDASAQRAAPLLLGVDESGAQVSRLRPGARVLDACAAPGGKTAHLLELADLDVLAIDSDAARLERVQETLDRLGLRASLRVADAAAPGSWWDGRPFDAILLDAPCSASGIVRRHPDVRWLRRPADIDALAGLQARLLDALWPLLAPGGRLLYATCSVFRAEGQEQIDAFLQRCHEAKVADAPTSPGHLLPLPDNGAAGPMLANPGTGDGFYYALLEKRHT